MGRCLIISGKSFNGAIPSIYQTIADRNEALTMRNKGSRKYNRACRRGRIWK